jgi:hypothetical protein
MVPAKRARQAPGSAFVCLSTLTACCAVAVAAAPVAGSTVSAPMRSSAGQQALVSGDAFGTSLRVGKTLKSGRSARVAIGAGGACSTGQELPIHRQDLVASAKVPELESKTGVIETEADAFEAAGVTTGRTHATVHDASLLDGLITAETIEAVSETTYDGSSFGTSADGSTFVHLRVGEQEFEGEVPANTRIDLPGIGFVVLNEQLRSEDARSAGLEVNMLHVKVTEENIFGYPVGSNLLVAHAASKIALKRIQRVPGLLDGRAYGTLAKGRAAGPPEVRFDSGPTAPVAVPCRGTDGEIRTNFVADVKVPADAGVLRASEITTTAQGDILDSSAYAETTATIERANVLDGLIGARVIRAVARAELDGGDVSLSDAGSSFAELSVEGHPELGADVAPNTRVELAGLGTLWLHRVIRKPQSIEVRMIELHVRVADNDLGLKVGTTVHVGVASASVHPSR